MGVTPVPAELFRIARGETNASQGVRYAAYVTLRGLDNTTYWLNLGRYDCSAPESPSEFLHYIEARKQFEEAVKRRA